MRKGTEFIEVDGITTRFFPEYLPGGWHLAAAGGKEGKDESAAQED